MIVKHCLAARDPYLISESCLQWLLKWLFIGDPSLRTKFVITFQPLKSMSWKTCWRSDQHTDFAK